MGDLRTGPSSGQATSISLLRHPKLPACHSGAALASLRPPTTFKLQSSQTCLLHLPMMPEQSSHPKGLFKIRSIDGGGKKGLYSAKIIDEIEKEYNSSICDHFDLICGTSTGGLIVLALSLRIPASEIVGFYNNHSSKIFPSRCSLEGWTRIFNQLFIKSKYGNQALASALKSLFRERKLNESKTLLCIPANPLTPAISFSRASGRPQKQCFNW
jgi:hypothetical protein